MMSPNGARRRCPTAGCQTQNGRSDDEYDSIPLYGSRNASCTRPPVSLSSPRDLSRSSRSMTRSHAPTAVGTSPTGLSGAPRRVRVRARRRAVGPTRRLCFVYIRVQGPGPAGPVAGGPRGRRYGPGNPDPNGWGQEGKGVKFTGFITALSSEIHRKMAVRNSRSSRASCVDVPRSRSRTTPTK